MLDRINQTDVVTDPYPHFWTENIFPDDIYEAVLREFPDGSCFLDGGKYPRNEMQLVSASVDQFSPSAKELWYGVRMALASDELRKAIFRKLGKGLAHRFGTSEEEAAKVNGYPRPMLFRETQGYAIAPHPDTRRKLATVQFAITEGQEQSELGTSIYRLSARPKDLVQKPRGFREVGRYPFVRNSVFAFSVVNTMTMRSWHGRDALPENCGIRRTILQIYYSDKADANKEMLSEADAIRAA